MKFTFHRRCGAFAASGRALVYVPDQVIANVAEFQGRTFPVLRRDGKRVRAALRPGAKAEGRVGGSPVVALR